MLPDMPLPELRLWAIRHLVEVGYAVVPCQLYVHDLVASVTRPVKQLRAFQRVSLKAGESKVVTLPIGPEALWLIDQQMVRRVEPGEFEILVGNSSATTLKAILTVK